MTIIKETSPHLHRKDSLSRMMIDVIIALLPAVIFSIVGFGLSAVRNLLVPIVLMVGAELLSILIRHKNKFKENFSITNILVPMVSAIIFGLIMPVKTDYPIYIWVALITGSLFGIILGKLVFGGTGHNIFNPAAIGMVFAKLCFGGHYVTCSPWWVDNTLYTGGTILGGDLSYASSFSIKDMMLGSIPGLPGEICKIAILIGLIYLLIRQAIDWRVVVSIFVSFSVITLVEGLMFQVKGEVSNAFIYYVKQLLAGGLLFGMAFMATDPVTSPLGRPGRMMYGALIGAIVCIIRMFGALPEGVVFAILIGNMFAPVIDYYKWASNKYSWNRILIIALIIVIPSLIMVWSIGVR